MQFYIHILLYSEFLSVEVSGFIKGTQNNWLHYYSFWKYWFRRHTAAPAQDCWQVSRIVMTVKRRVDIVHRVAVATQCCELYVLAVGVAILFVFLIIYIILITKQDKEYPYILTAVNFIQIRSPLLPWFSNKDPNLQTFIFIRLVGLRAKWYT